MNLEEKICIRYEAMLAWIAFLDRAYYLNKAPSRAERAEYFARQQEREAVRNQLYWELHAVRRGLDPTRPN